ncbi:helix-turn-helix domain-containing protein [Listeria seeligeri]|uniref:helix-turn-helix domain-containing protein n=1 Tax=Listeria seeligeri TaxID=1640 RepID=UPI0021AB526A|nr:helix-turn-helix transcriptional regulator [Listeria seeligeri]
MLFKDRLKQLRLEKKLTQAELGKKINVTNVSVSGYESGNRFPDTATLEKLASFFDVTTDYLLGRSDIRHPEKLKKLVDDKALNSWLYDLIENKPEDVQRLKELMDLMNNMANKSK